MATSFASPARSRYRPMIDPNMGDPTIGAQQFDPNDPNAPPQGTVDPNDPNAPAQVSPDGPPQSQSGQPNQGIRYNPTPQTGKYTPGQSSITGAYQENRDLAKTNSDRFGAQGDAINQETINAQNRYGADQSRYQANADQIASGIQKTPGYTADEAAKIAPDYTQNKTGSALNDRYLTSDEGASIGGNPWAAQDYLNTEQVMDAVNDSSRNQNNATKGLQQGVQGVVDNSQIRQSPGYSKALQGALGTEDSRLGSAIDRSKLALDPSFAGKYNMSDADVRDIEDKAGRGVGNRYQSQKDDLARRAAADGNTSPMAMAAMNEQLSRDSGVQSADAMTDARLAARGEQAGRLQTSEGMRGAFERDISGRQMSAATTMGQQQTDAATQQEALRQRGETTLTADQLQAADIGGQAGIATADRTGKEYVSADQWGQEQGVGIAQKADQASSDRNRYIAADRQGVTSDVQNTGYNQANQTQQLAAGGAQAVADARRGGTNTVLDYNAGQQAAAQAGDTTARGQQIQGTAVVGGLQNQAAGIANQATEGSSQHSAQPGVGQQIGQQILGAGLGALAKNFGKGGVVTKPTMAVLGDKGPEAVIPLDPGKDAKLPPGMMMKVRNRYRRPGGDRQMPTATDVPLIGSRVYR